MFALLYVGNKLMGFSVLFRIRGVSESERANLINRKVSPVSPGENETSDGNKLMVYDGMKNAFPNRKQVSSESRFIVGSDLEVKSQV